MGKKRIVTSGGETVSERKAGQPGSSSLKKRFARGKLYIKATYNNTILTLADPEGNVILWSSSGAMGFKGAKKGTPFAASKVAEQVFEKAQGVGLKELDIVMNGVGAGREAAVRSFISKGVEINSIQDVTPIPFNGPKPKKPRRV